VVDFDPATGEVGQPGAQSDPSSHVFESIGRATGVPTVRVDAVKQNKGCLHFRLSTSGSNPLVKPAPPIDMRASLTVSLSKEHLNLHGELTGDLFPNGEVLVLDHAGTARMIESYETDGSRNLGPARLYNKGYERMNGICLSLPIDASGRFV
jgi:hypothetical protein